jgi:phosphatidate phosphatase PAH1
LDRIGEIEALVDADRVNRYRTVMALFSPLPEWIDGPRSRALASALMVASCIGIGPVADAQTQTQRTVPVVVDGPKFDVPGEPSGFERRRNRVGVPALGTPNHRGRDVIAVAGTPQAVIAKFTYGAADKDLTREPVDLYVNSLGPEPSAWRHFGVAVTTRNRDTVSLAGVKNDGGRIFVEPKEPLAVGRHRLAMRVRGDLSLAWIDAAIVAPNTQAVVFDIDGTLTIGDGELVTQITERLRTGESYTPKVHAGAVDVARKYAEKGYLVIYLTGRPDFLSRLTRHWLVTHGFPPGPIRYADRIRQARASLNGVCRFKTAQLIGWRDQKLDIVAAYGNASTDIAAYAALGLSVGHTYIVGPRAGQGDTTAVRDYREHLSVVDALPTARVTAPPSPGWGHR